MSSAKTPPKKKKKWGWGGARPGAGRKPDPNRKHPYAPHRARPRLDYRKPIRLTLRAHEGRTSFNQRRVAALVAQVIKEKNDDAFTVVRSTLHASHIDLVVRAKNAGELSRHMQGLMIAIARRYNALLERRGKLWADRWQIAADGSGVTK